MSYQGVVEIAIQLESFKNLDLYHQGLYNVRFRIYQEIDNQIVFAYPYHLEDKYDKKKPTSKALLGPQIIDSNFYYVSKTFFIRFNEEELDLNEICSFRAEYDAASEVPSCFFIEADLMFADMNKIPPPQDSNDPYEHFRALKHFKAKVSYVQQGIHEFVPVLFDEGQFGVMNTLIHGILTRIDFKFKPSPVEPPRREEGMNQNNNQIEKPKVEVPNIKTFTEYLAYRTNSLDYDSLEAFYNYYVRGLKRSYERLIENHAFFMKILMQGEPSTDLKKFIVKNTKVNNVRSNYLQDGPKDLSDSKEESKIDEKKPGKLARPQKLFDPNQDKPLSELLDKESPDKTAYKFLQEMNLQAAMIFQAWHSFIELTMIAKKATSAFLREEYLERIKDRWAESAFQELYTVSDFTATYDSKIGETHNKIATAKRNSSYYKQLSHTIENLKMFPKPEHHPILFEEICFKDEASTDIPDEISLSEKEKTHKGIHLIVLCHGFQGNSWDMRLFKNNLNYLYPDNLYLCSSANEDNTDEEISDLGKRLASEVKGYITEWIPGRNLGRLSFIGHSLGGLIIRAALPHLEEYAKKFHLLLTLSSPHLGCTIQSSKLIDAGMWVLKKWKKSKCLAQLTLTDAQKIEDTSLYKLSSYKGLEWFKHIALVSSYQDMYVPFESARIQPGAKSASGTKNPVYVQMAKNLLDDVKASCIHRIDINFKIAQKNIDSMIGRTAHIQFLDNQALLRMLAYRYSNFFA